MFGNNWLRATLPFEFLARGLNIVLCAEPFVTWFVAVKNRITDGMCFIVFLIFSYINWKQEHLMKK